MNHLEGKVILVTGANGFIGTHLVAKLHRIHGVKLLLLSRQPKQSASEDVIWLEGELESLTPAFWEAHHVDYLDYVFHLGGFTPKNGSTASDIERNIRDNISGTYALLKSLPGVPSGIIFSSTLDVYAPPKDGEVLTESSMLQPTGFYGASKLLCEKLISTWAAANGCRVAILRYGHIYGAGEGQYGKLIPVAIRSLLANQAPRISGDGSVLRDYLFVGDALEATIRAAQAESSVGPVNIVSGTSVTLKSVMQVIQNIIGNGIRAEYLLDKPSGVSLRFDASLMKKIFGDWPMTTLEEGLKEEVEAFTREQGKEKK